MEDATELGAVYRFYDEAGVLLYVGRSYRLPDRLSSHRRDAQGRGGDDGGTLADVRRRRGTTLMGRPPIGRMVNVRYPAPLLAKLDARAAAAGITRAELLRRIAEQAMEDET